MVRCLGYGESCGSFIIGLVLDWFFFGLSTYFRYGFTVVVFMFIVDIFFFCLCGREECGDFVFVLGVRWGSMMVVFFELRLYLG